MLKNELAVQSAIDKPFKGMFSGRINFLPLGDVVSKRAAGFSISRGHDQSLHFPCLKLLLNHFTQTKTKQE